MWQSYMNFMADHGRRPSKYKPEERNLVNWLKYNRKEVNQGTFPESRKKMFDELLQMAERLHRVNQWKEIHYMSRRGASQAVPRRMVATSVV